MVGLDDNQTSVSVTIRGSTARFGAFLPPVFLPLPIVAVANTPRKPGGYAGRGCSAPKLVCIGSSILNLH